MSDEFGAEMCESNEQEHVKIEAKDEGHIEISKIPLPPQDDETNSYNFKCPLKCPTIPDKMQNCHRDSLPELKIHSSVEVSNEHFKGSPETFCVPLEIDTDSTELKHVPKRPWITKEFMEMVQQRDKLYFRLKNNPGDTVLKNEYSICRNQTAKLRKKLKLAYQMYLEEL